MAYDPKKYDPRKAHAYYEQHKRLKGRDSAGAPIPPPPPKIGQGSRVIDSQAGSSGHATRKPFRPATQEVQARVVRLKTAVSKLQGALSAAEAALSAKRQAAAKAAKASSDGKSTAAEKKASQQYRDKHKTALSSKQQAQRKAAGSTPKSGTTAGSSTSTSSTSTSSSSTSSVSTMSVSELQTRVTHIKSALAEAKRQLSNATQQLGQLAHSDITSEPEFDEHFARFRSAERMPSQ